MSKIQIKRNLSDLVSYIPLTICAGITIVVIVMIYKQTQNVLKERLRERLTSIAATAVLQFNPNDIKKMQKENKKDIPELVRTIGVMKRIRDANENIKYIYIWSRTNDPNQVAFTADAEMLQPIDRDGNGLIEDAEIPPDPGEPYDISESPTVQIAFDHPYAQEEFLVDKWGTFLSGFAPIKDEQGKTIAILGMDVEVGDFQKIVRAMFIPFILQAAILLIILTIQTISLIRIWKSRIELVREADRQKDALLSLVSHQLAAPVTSIKWYLEMLKDGDIGSLQKEQQEAIGTMQGITVNLADLVGMILDVSRIQLGKIHIEPTPLDLNGFFKEILDVVEPKAIEKELKFEKKIPAAMPTVLLDRRYTRMTVENLLTNAIKYTPNKGSVTWTVTIDGGTMHLEVKDTGYGIPKAEQGQIFGKMFRASNVRNAKDGNGFGLYVAKGAIEAQGGKIWFESEEGKGTTFFIELPLVLAPDKPSPNAK